MKSDLKILCCRQNKYSQQSFCIQGLFLLLSPVVRCSLVLCCFVLLVGPSSLFAEPTLARLSFWLAPERIGEFEAVYLEQVVPVLKQRGLEASSLAGRATVDSVFSRLFEVNDVAEVDTMRARLKKDEAWRGLLKNLGSRFGTFQTDGLLPFGFKLYSAPAGFGTAREVTGKKGVWYTFTARDGMQEGEPYAICQDRVGHLWIGTMGGVNRFDGQRFVQFTTDDGLANDQVLSLYLDRDGYLWIGTRGGGVSRYNPSARGSAAWKTFGIKEGLVGDKVYAIHQDGEGIFWFATRSGVSRFDPSASLRTGGENWTSFTAENSGLAHNQVYSMFQDGEGNFWFGTRGGGVSHFDGEHWKTYTTEDGLAHNHVKGILQDAEGDIWFGTYGGGMSRFDGTKFTHVSLGDFFINSVKALYQDKEGNIWAGADGGLSKYKGRTITIFKTDNNGMLADGVSCIFQDRDGYLWFGHRGGGVSRYSSGSFTIFGSDDPMGETRSIYQDRDGTLWLGGPGGLVQYDGKNITVLRNIRWSATQHRYSCGQRSRWISLGRYIWQWCKSV